MGRLIDADVVEDMLRDYANNAHKRNDKESAVGLNLAVLMLRNVPTAYDVERVVEHINKIEVERSEYSEMVRCNMDENACSSNCYECIINHVVKIVHNGGKV